MKIDSQLLRQHVYNTLLWTPGKGEQKRSPSGGLVSVSFGNNAISFLSTDAYTVVQTGAVIQEDGDALYVLGSDLKLLENELRTVEGDVEVLSTENFLIVSVASVEIGLVDPPDPKFWKAIRNILFDTYSPDLSGDFAFAVDPRRLSKFSLLEPRDKYPTDFIIRDTAIGQQILLWKHGPHSRGAVAPLNREVLWETYGPDDIGDVLW